MKGKLEEVDQLREELEADIRSVVRLIPNLNEEKKRLQNAMNATEKRIGDIERAIPKLEKQKAELNEDVRLEKEQIARLDQQIEFIRLRKERSEGPLASANL